MIGKTILRKRFKPEFELLIFIPTEEWYIIPGMDNYLIKNICHFAGVHIYLG